MLKNHNQIIIYLLVIYPLAPSNMTLEEQVILKQEIREVCTAVLEVQAELLNNLHAIHLNMENIID